MAGDTVITVIGNLTADPEIRYTSSGAAVCSFTVASTPRTFDRQAGEWRDGDTLFMRCSAWREMAENVAESLTKGSRVIVQGRLVQRSYTARDGSERTSMELQVDEVGASLRYAKAQLTRVARAGGAGGGYQQAPAQGGYNAGGYQQQAPAQYQQQAPASQPRYNAPAGGAPDDPWATGGVSSFGDEPPF